MKFSKYILYLILLVFPLGQLVRLRIPFFSGVYAQPLEIFMFIFVLSVFFLFYKKSLFKGKTKKPQISFFFKEMVFFGAIASFSFLIKAFTLGSESSVTGFFYLLRLWNFFLFYYALCLFLGEEKISLKKPLFWIGSFVALLSVLQYIFIPDTRFLFESGWDMHYFRAIGPFLDPSFNALILLLSLLVLLTESTGKFKKVELLMGFLIFIAIALSFSRIVYFLLTASIVAILLLKRKKQFVFLLILFGLLIFLLPKPTGEGVDLFRVSSFINRSDNYRQATTIIKDNFWLGVGYNNYRIYQKNYGFLSAEDWETSHAGAGADNSFLFVLATTGVFGLILYLNIWYVVLKKAVGLLKKSKEGLLLVLSAGVVLTSSFVINSLFYPWIVVWLFVLLASFTVENER